MSSIEFAVIAVGGLLGYGVVAFFLKSGKPALPPPGAAESDTLPAQRPEPRWPEVLQLSPLATPEEIRAAYHRLAAQYQPEPVQTLGPELRELAARRLAEIETAYQEALHERAGPA